MSYYKRVAYIDYYENGVKVGNSGFVKWMKLQDGREDLQIHITNFPLRGVCWEMVKLLAGTQEVLLGQVEINERKGLLEIKSLEEALKNGGIRREGGSGMQLRVEIAPFKVLACELEPEETGGMPEAVEKPVESRPEENSRQEKIVQPQYPPEKRLQEEDDREKGYREKNYQEVKNQEKHYQEESCEEDNAREEKWMKENRRSEKQQGESWKEVVTAESGNAARQPGLRMMQVHRDKWKQLSETFPLMRPFQDEREYLRLGLQDLIILPRLYYRLVENSFLLHGYYNYEHLILAKLYKKGTEKYYIGVPGNYYEKEKQVAVLFGFESFEPKTEPAAEGDYGYYMISVDI